MDIQLKGVLLNGVVKPFHCNTIYGIRPSRDRTPVVRFVNCKLSNLSVALTTHLL
jgi:hypothetical protein